jgi:hypothetical protein
MDHLSVARAQVGDWLEVNGLPGWPPRRGEIVEVLGPPGHVHFRVRWDEKHESLFYPSSGAAIVHPAVHGGRDGRS